MGNDRYSTEICLQKFRGELVLLDGREGQSGAPAQPASNLQAFETELDDDVPFARCDTALEHRVG